MTPQTGEWALTGGSQHKRIVKFYKADQMVVGGQIPMANTRLAILDPVYQRRIDDDGGPTPMNPFAGIVPVPSDRVTTFQWADGLMRLSPALPQDIAAYGKVPLKHYDNDLGWTASVECRFAGKPVRLSISTGSPHAITFNPDAVKRLGLWDAPGPFYARGGRYLGDSIEVRVRRAPGDLELGGVRIATPVVGLRDPAKQLADVYWTDGTIGMDVLRRFDVVFDPRRDTSWLRPVLPAEAPWTYDRAGFQVEPAEGAARIARVDAGSPAASAGLKVGDVIATNAQNVAKLMAAQSMPAGTKIELPIVRDGQKMRIAIVNAERL